MKKKLLWLVLVLAVLTVGTVFFLQRDSGSSSIVDGNMTLTDSQGREVTFNAPTDKLITLTNADTEVLAALGVKPMATVVNFNMSEKTEAKMADVPKVGVVTAPDLEAIVAMKPDLVIGGPMPFQLQLASSLDNAGIPIAYLRTNSYREILGRIRLLGAITGKKKAADNIATKIEKRVGKVREQYADRPKKKILIVWGTVASFQLASSQTFAGDLVAQVPVENLADQFADRMTDKGLGAGFVALDMEFISQADADAIFVIIHGVSRDGAHDFLRTFEEQPAWKNLRAVREGHLYHLPAEMFAANPNVRVADSVEYVGELLYGGE